MKTRIKKIRQGISQTPKKVVNKVKAVRGRNDPISEPGQAPRITNQSVAEHREEILSSARKYIYPLQQSKHRIVVVSTTLFVTAFVIFFTYTTVALYRLKSYSTFLYRVTQVLPFPVAKAGSHLVAYENYLFELKHYIHYYQDQQKLDFNSESGRQQLAEFKKRALQKVVNDAYIKQLANQYKVNVTGKEVDEAILMVRQQNRLGDNDKVFEDVLREYWGWSLADFRRSLSQQLLAQKLLPYLDPATKTRADQALAELRAGADFAATAKKYSDDPSKEAGGDYGITIDKTNRDISPQAAASLFSLKAGQYSDIVNTGYALEIFKVNEVQGEKVKASHIVFNFKDISAYLNDIKEKQKPRLFVSL